MAPRPQERKHSLHASGEPTPVCSPTSCRKKPPSIPATGSPFREETWGGRFPWPPGGTGPTQGCLGVNGINEGLEDKQEREGGRWCMAQMGLCNQPLSLRGDGAEEGQSGRSGGAGQEPHSFPSLCSTGRVSLAAGRSASVAGAGTEPSPRAGRRGLGFGFPVRAVWHKAQRTLVPTSSTPLCREAQTSILPAQHPCRQSSLLPSVFPFPH